jgi:Rho GTPase-activating protein RGD1
MGKAKNKYDVLAEQYDRARTGDRQSGRFGLKTKSAAQQEEELNRKVQAADTDYASKVQTAQTSRQELITSLRPQAVRALTELIMECDSGVTLQLQKFASLNEKLLLGNGLCVSPLKTQPNGIPSDSKSLREVSHNIDNEKDFRDYILSFSNKAGTRTSEIKYEKHPTLASPKQAQPPSQPPQQSFDSSTNAHQNQGPLGPPGGFDRGHRPSQSGQISGVTPYQPPNRDGPPMHMQPNQYPGGPVPSPHPQAPPYLGVQIPQIQPHSPINMSGTSLDRSDGPQAGPPPPNFGGADSMRSRSGSGPGPIMNNQNQYREDFQQRPPQGANSQNPYREDFQQRPPQGPDSHFRSPSQPQPPVDNFNANGNPQFMPPANIGQPRRSDGPRTDLPPIHPVFGVTLDELFRRDETAVPSIVHQCTVAVELFGLDVEGIYRTSGSNPHIMELKAMFDNGEPSKSSFLIKLTSSSRLFPSRLPQPHNLPPRHQLRHHPPQKLPPRSPRPASHFRKLHFLPHSRQNRRQHSPPRLPPRNHQ